MQNTQEKQPKFKVGDIAFVHDNFANAREFGPILKVIETKSYFFYQDANGGYAEFRLFATKNEAIARQIKILKAQVAKNEEEIQKIKVTQENLIKLVEKLEKVNL